VARLWVLSAAGCGGDGYGFVLLRVFLPDERVVGMVLWCCEGAGDG